MIKITCKCTESFRISEQNIVNKVKVKCPNCDQQISDEILESLIAYANAKLEADKSFEKVNELFVPGLLPGQMVGEVKKWFFSIEK